MIMFRRGFTIVELIITITIMGILLTLAVVNVGTTQAKARDDSRKSDIEAIASNLESFYISGTNNSTDFARYPSVGVTGSAANITTNLRDANLNSFLPPGTTDVSQTFLPSTNTGSSPSIQTTAGVLPQPTIAQYVYQPIKSDGSVCQSGEIDCRKFNLFYRLETDNTVYKWTSKNQ
ncbi:MAG: type II secretion system protein [Candidatus Microsaccharimonas sossegonensis]|uniref:Type II secretion system protein n=1 Tax=Candidatus Microsaccharimonas sossegonensis TaxID=2506948 RepID=A0A4Q0AHZ1_9BACT|nr:MAG: type II secretion system protein [Candidatus Microsaccharimonas sossegonensis]